MGAAAHLQLGKPGHTRPKPTALAALPSLHKPSQAFTSLDKP
jgi:hypothetical protein